MQIKLQGALWWEQKPQDAGKRRDLGLVFVRFFILSMKEPYLHRYNMRWKIIHRWADSPGYLRKYENICYLWFPSRREIRENAFGISSVLTG